MSVEYPMRLELRQRVYLQLASQSRLLTTIIVLLLVGLVAAFVLLVPGDIIPKLKSMPSLVEWLMQTFSRDPVQGVMNLVVLAVATVQIFYMQSAKRMERLVLTHEGIEYRSPLPEIFRFLRPGWSLSWGQIRSIKQRSLPFGRGPQLVVLELDIGLKTVKLYPWRWVDPGTFGPATPWRELRRQQKMTARDIMQEIDESPLVRYITAALPHLEIHFSGAPMDVPFALEKNPASLTIALLFFALVIYAFADGVVLGEETYAGEIPFHWFVMTGVLAAAFAGLWMVRSDVPRLESFTVALLFGAAVGVAAYPAILRVNEFTDTEGLKTYEYILQSDRITLTPVASGPPDLAFPKYADYWIQFESGSKHEFELRYGGLGFYQLDFEPVRRALREYYEKHRK
jgi:hypothetical protein